MHTTTGRPPRPHLVVVRAGDSSLHPTWTAGGEDERTFDLAVDYYGSTPGRWAGTADHYVEAKGSKWRGLARLLAANPSWLTDYEAVWFPDDDLAADAATIDGLFELHAALGLGLSQPSLTHDSYFTHHITLAHPGLSVRVTDFVEVMAPMFSRVALQACAATFAESESGFGLDLAWQSILPGLGLKSAIFDCLQVRHTRPLGTGTLYAGMTESPVAEGARVARAHGVPPTTPATTLEALDAQLQVVPELDLARRVLADPPHPTVQEVPAWDGYLAGMRARAAAGSAWELGRVQPLAPAAVQRPVVLAPRGARADLSHLDLDRPVTLVVADDGLDRVLAWRLAGWQTVVIPAGDPELLAEHLHLAEALPARALDVEASSAVDLAVAARLAARVGAPALVRPRPEALRCAHAAPESVCAALGRCQACRQEWAAVAALAAAVVADPADTDRLVALGVPRDLVAGQVAPAPAPTAAPQRGGVAVVLFAHARPAFTSAVLAALAGQRGLDGALEVVVVPVTGASLPAPRPSSTGSLRVSTAPTGGPAGFAAAVRSVGAARVLVLDATDVPGPWCVHEHARPAGVLVGRGRTSLALTDDAWTDAVHAPGAVPAPSQRVSVPVALAVETSATHAVASAATATAVLAAGRPVDHLAAPTHTALALDDVDAHLRSATLAALAGAVAVPATGPVPAALAAELTHWTRAGAGSLDLLRQLAPVPAAQLRTAVVDWVAGEGAADLVARVLTEATAAHWAAAMGAAHAARTAGRTGEPLVISLAARDPRLLELLGRLASGSLSPRAFQVLLVLDPREGDERAFAQRFAQEVTTAGLELSSLPDVRVVVSEEPATARLDAHVTLPVQDAAWSPGLPVPLLGLPLATWLAYLDVAHLLEQPSRDLTTTSTATSTQGVSC